MDPVDERRLATNRYERFKVDESAARACGVDLPHLYGMREQVRVERTRGRRAAGEAVDLHIPVAGQGELFAAGES